MRKVILLSLSIFFAISIQAQTDKEAAIKKTIETFFEGLHKGDSTIASKVLHTSFSAQTTSTNAKGIKVLGNDSREKLLTSIANKKKEHKYFEKLLSFDIKIDGNLASVWTPYEFYFNDNFSHCGANSFQLFDNNGEWQIIYVVDMRRRNSCKALK